MSQMDLFTKQKQTLRKETYSYQRGRERWIKEDWGINIYTYSEKAMAPHSSTLA